MISKLVKTKLALPTFFVHIPTKEEINEDQVVVTIRERLQCLPKRWKDMPSANIFRAPKYIREDRRDLYEPTLVSIGPYNRGNEALKPMEEHKWRCLREFLSTDRITYTEATLVRAMQDVAPDARRCYLPGAPLGKPNNFVEMLLLDGCLIIDILIKSMLGKRQYMPTIGWNSPPLMADLLKLENQIPFCVLLKLYEILGRAHSPLPGNRADGLVFLAFNYLKPKNLTGVSVRIPGGSEVHHLLHLYHLINMPSPKQLQPDHTNFLFRICGHVLSTFESCLHLQIKASPGRTASKLVDFGVTIKAKKSDCHFLDITFHKGTLEIPSQLIDPSFKAIITNILLFEQRRDNPDKYWIAYANFLDDLVDTREDIALLKSSGVIEDPPSKADELAKNDELATFINQLVPDSILDPERCDSELYLRGLSNRMDKYCQSRWNRWMAKARVTLNWCMDKLKRDYFSTPWSTISVLAAFVLLCLTILQTIYTMKSYLRPPK